MSSIFYAPTGFHIRSLADAAQVLNKYVVSGSEITVLDENRTHYLRIWRPNKEPAVLCYDKVGKEWYDPDFMVSGKEAIELLWKHRKIFNAWLKKKEKE